jgi:hypothetical protein
MMSESHLRGTEFSELQVALWRRQFESLRDGDRFFYLNDPALREIRTRYGISYRHTLAELIRALAPGFATMSFSSRRTSDSRRSTFCRHF